MTREELKREALKGAVDRLRGERASDEVRIALTTTCGLYLETWVIPTLQTLSEENPTREELELAWRLSR